MNMDDFFDESNDFDIDEILGDEDNGGENVVTIVSNSLCSVGCNTNGMNNLSITCGCQIHL